MSVCKNGYDDAKNNSGYLSRIQFDGTTVWQLTNMDDYGRIRQASIGAAAGTWTYDANNMLSQIAATGVQQYDYSFNVNTGNLNSRTNFLKNKTESFGYDSDKLDRLASVTGPEDLDISYTTNNNGNIYSKSDAGNYTLYDGYAVKEISDAQNIPETYQEIEYYSFEKVKKITEGDKTADFEYNADRQRIRMTLKTSGVTTKTRWYFGSSCEREDVGGTITNYIWIGGDAYTAIAVAKKTGTGSWTVYNIFRDHLGTITHLKNVSTGVVDEYSFDAWGRRRDKDDWTYTLTGEPALFADRGFTAHEYLADFNLYNMNGRMYDPVVGRFLSPDPFVGGGDYTQGFNRYSYALNNPLIYTDPNGENPLFFIIGAVIGAYVGGSASNGWQWNPGKWDYGDPGTYFGIIGGGLAGGLGAQWMFGPGGVLSGGTQVGINIGVSFDKIGVAFANFSFGEGAGLAFEGLGYATIAGGGVYITANALDGWLSGDGNPPVTPEQKVDLAIAQAASSGGNSFNERVFNEFINYSESTIDGLTYTVTGLGAALSGGFRNMKLDWKYNGAAHVGEGRWFPGKHDPAYAYGFTFENGFTREAIEQSNVSWSNGKRIVNGTLGILLFPMEFSKTGYKALDFLIDQAITGGIGYGVGKGLDKIPNY